MKDIFVLHSFNQAVANGEQPYRGQQGRSWVMALGLPFLLVFPLFGTFLLAMVVPSTVQNWSQEQRLRTSGAPISGVVVELTEESDSDGSSYRVTYQYQVQLANSKARPFQHQEPVTSDIYQRLEQGDRVELRYLPDQPDVARLANNIDHSAVNVLLLGVFLLVWTLGFCGLPLYLALRLIKAWRKDQRLVQRGRLVIGELTDLRGTLDSDDDYLIELRYRFSSPLGTMIEHIETGIHNQFKGSVVPAGTPVAIWYLDEQHYTLL